MTKSIAVPDYNIDCEACGNTPCVTVEEENNITHIGLCGPCTWGDADTLYPENW